MKTVKMILKDAIEDGIARKFEVRDSRGRLLMYMDANELLYSGADILEVPVVQVRNGVITVVK